MDIYEMSMMVTRLLAILAVWAQNKIISPLMPAKPGNLRVFYIGGYWRGQNDVVAQMLHGLKSTGARVFEFNTDEHHAAIDTEERVYDRGTTGPVWLVKDQLFPLILQFRPHLIVCNAGGLSFRQADTANLRKWGIKLLGIALSDPEVFEPTTSKISKNFDVFYTGVNKCIEWYKKIGVHAYRLPLGTNNHFFHPVPSRPEYMCDVLLLGAVHQDRIEPVKALVENFDTHVYGENWENYGIQNRGFVFGEETLSALSSAKMVVIFSKTVTGYQGVKVGVFDFLAAGSLVITDDIPELHEYFVVGKEVVAFRGTEDMLHKVKYYLDHPEEADAIRKAGREKVINNYTYDKIWLRILASVTA